MPISDAEQFVLIHGECLGYRDGNKPCDLVKEAILPDAFVVDFVRVFDVVT